MQQNLDTSGLELTEGTLKVSKPNRLLELEGQCKLSSIKFLTIAWLKAILLMIPLTASLVGLLLLKYYKSLRVLVFYQEVPHGEADYVYLQGVGGVTDIERVVRGENNPYFFFKKLKYELHGEHAVPAGYLYEKDFDSYMDKVYLLKGTDVQTRQRHLREFGTNQHKVDVPFYFQYLFDTMTKPFFLLQYLICIIYFFEKISTFAILMIVFSLVTTTINYILLYISFRKIKEIAENIVQVRVIRDGQDRTISNTQLLPGDIFRPEKGQQVLCDALLLEGEVFVNQASLTGESIPIGKFPVATMDHLKEENRWLYEGAKILQSRPNSLAMVVNVGYSTRRGRIIRKILTRVATDPDFFITAVYFLVETCIVGIILYLATLGLMLRIPVPNDFIVYRFLDFLAWSFPPTFPIYFNLAYSLSLARMRKKNIIGTEPQKTVDAAKVKIMCFDKTGTLTLNTVKVHKILKFVNEVTVQDITLERDDRAHELIFKLFASCHTAKNIEGELLGDQVDVRMFLYSAYKLETSADQTVKFLVTNQKGSVLEVLRINQFQSRFQNMSVFVRDVKTSKHYAFLKGAPERIDRNSELKVKEFQNIVATLSLGGYRTIGFGYREVPDNELNDYLNSPREIFDKGIKAMGLVAFQNQLKPDTRATIERLNASGIESKMITGDNIYIAVQTGVRAGLIQQDEKVILLQGRKQKFQGTKRVFTGVLLERDAMITKKTIVLLDESTDYLTQSCAMAVDNDFLMLEPEPYLPDQIKLFSRISPENKALVVKRFKEQLKVQYDAQQRSQRWFGNGLDKVGMAGDGANDLMAIREADVGLGISDSDASYGASFSIVNMLDVDYIVRQSKCTSQNIVEMIRYFGTISFLKIITALLLMSDATYFHNVHITYFNFAHTIWVPVLMAITWPCEESTRHRPMCNLLSAHNHVIYWANIIFPTIGFIAGYFYFTNTTAFIKNPSPVVDPSKGYHTVNDTATIVWLMINIPLILNAFLVYTSEPFKVRFFRNIPLLVLVTANLAAAIAFFFTTSSLLYKLALLPIPVDNAGIVLAIMLSAMLLSFFFSRFVESRSTHRINPEELPLSTMTNLMTEQ